ncbi:MAG: YheU family protein [Pseudohongiellaceae bacterium]
MNIPHQEVAAETLTAIIEEFISREGTEYGAQEYSLEQKVEQVRKQLERGEIVLNYDPETQSCDLQLAVPR